MVACSIRLWFYFSKIFSAPLGEWRRESLSMCSSDCIMCIESWINSRPLVPLSTDPHDLGALTPAHFLIGKPLIHLPDINISSNCILRLSYRQKLITQARNQFWSWWQKEYLSTLSLWRKWQHWKQNPKEGQLVLLKNPAPYYTPWRFARIERVHPGSDNMVWVATIRTSEGLFKRSLHQLAALPDVIDGGDWQSIGNEDMNSSSIRSSDCITWLFKNFVFFLVWHCP